MNNNSLIINLENSMHPKNNKNLPYVYRIFQAFVPQFVIQCDTLGIQKHTNEYKTGTNVSKTDTKGIQVGQMQILICTHMYTHESHTQTELHLIAPDCTCIAVIRKSVSAALGQWVSAIAMINAMIKSLHKGSFNPFTRIFFQLLIQLLAR